MKLYGALASPYVARVVMFADLKGLELPMEPAPGGMGSDEYRKISATGKIPALEVDGQASPEPHVRAPTEPGARTRRDGGGRGPSV